MGPIFLKELWSIGIGNRDIDRCIAGEPRPRGMKTGPKPCSLGFAALTGVWTLLAWRAVVLLADDELLQGPFLNPYLYHYLSVTLLLSRSLFLSDLYLYTSLSLSLHMCIYDYICKQKHQ